MKPTLPFSYTGTERENILAHLRYEREEIDTAIRVIEAMALPGEREKTPAPAYEPRKRKAKSNGLKQLDRAISEKASAEGWMSRAECLAALGISGATLTGYKATLKLEEGVHFRKNGNGSNRHGERWNLSAIELALKRLPRRIVRQAQPTADEPVEAAATLAELNEP